MSQRVDLAAWLIYAAGDTVIVVHAAFVVFVVLGGLLALRWRPVVWLHAPAAVWGILVEFSGWTCPLTPLENHLRAHTGVATYQGDFIQQHLLKLLYPTPFPRSAQLLLGGFALAVNAFVYMAVFKRRPVHRLSEGAPRHPVPLEADRRR